MDSGALDALVGCLEEFDPSVKEAAGWALGCAAHPLPFDYPYRYLGYPYRYWGYPYRYWDCPYR